MAVTQYLLIISHKILFYVIVAIQNKKKKEKTGECLNALFITFYAHSSFITNLLTNLNFFWNTAYDLTFVNCFSDLSFLDKTDDSLWKLSNALDCDDYLKLI